MIIGDLIFLIFHTFASIVQVAVVSDDNYYGPQELKGVAAISMHKQGYFADDCKFTGLMVPYAKTWDTESKNQDTGAITAIQDAAPAEIEAYAIVVNQRTCKGVTEPVFMFTEKNLGIFKEGYNRLVKNRGMMLTELASVPKDDQPKWLPQVMARIDEAAASDPTAKAFVEFNRSAVEAAKAKAAQASAPSALKPATASAVASAIVAAAVPSKQVGIASHQ